MNPSLFKVFQGALFGQLAAQYPECMAGTCVPEPQYVDLFRQAACIAHGGTLPAKGTLTELESIFNHVNHHEGHLSVLNTPGGRYNGTGTDVKVSTVVIRETWKNGISAIPDDPAFANAMLELAEEAFSAVPADRDSNVRHDISMFQHAKISAAVACCLAMAEKAGNEKPFVLYSVDFSGIQKFIYTITSSGALKGLRSRSLYLTLFLYFITDEILDIWELSRANLIYAGGGKAYLLLPNVPELLDKTDRYMDDVNQYLREHHGTSLYVAHAWVPANEDDLTSGYGKTNAFPEMFRRVSREISSKKQNRYTAEQILELNSRKTGETDECAICGAGSRLRTWKEIKICDTCYHLENFAATLQNDTSIFCVRKEKTDTSLPLPAADQSVYWLSCGNDAQTKNARRVYAINRGLWSCPCSVRVSTSRHKAVNDEGEAALFSDLAECSTGIPRLGVFRCDVDNLGMLFANGFVTEKPEPWKAYNLARYSALSSAMTWFFQSHIDEVLEGKGDEALLKAAPEGKHVAVVYAGGDDVFLIGSWNDTLNAGMKLQKAFEAYTDGAVSLSGGFCIYPEHTPVMEMAESTAEMEDAAKGMVDGQKNGVALFGRLYDFTEGFVPRWHWDTFRSNVLKEKVTLLKEVFDKDLDKGNSFLYHVLELFREIETQPIAVARLAYLLSRHMPDDQASVERKKAYNNFMRKAYAWAMESGENRAFRTACLIYVYLNRTTINS